MQRLTGRRTCSLTGKLLNIYFSPQAELDECVQKGGELLQRDSDGYLLDPAVRVVRLPG